MRVRTFHRIVRIRVRTNARHGLPIGYPDGPELQRTGAERTDYLVFSLDIRPAADGDVRSDQRSERSCAYRRDGLHLYAGLL